MSKDIELMAFKKTFDLILSAILSLDPNLSEIVLWLKELIIYCGDPDSQ